MQAPDSDCLWMKAQTTRTRSELRFRPCSNSLHRSLVSPACDVVAVHCTAPPAAIPPLSRTALPDVDAAQFQVPRTNREAPLEPWPQGHPQPTPPPTHTQPSHRRSRGEPTGRPSHTQAAKPGAQAPGFALASALGSGRVGTMESIGFRGSRPEGNEESPVGSGSIPAPTPALSRSCDGTGPTGCSARTLAGSHPLEPGADPGRAHAQHHGDATAA